MPVVKPQTANHLIRNLGPAQPVLQHPGLGIGAVKYGAIPVRHSLAAVHAGDILTDDLRLVHLILSAKVPNGNTALILRPQHLFIAPCIFGNHRSSRLKNRARRAIILLQFDHRGIGIIPLKIQNIADIGASEAVHTLIIIPHHAQVPVASREEVEQVVLRHIGILILIHHNIAQAALITFEHLGMAAHELDRTHEQIVKIQGRIVLQTPLIQGVDVRHHLIEAKIAGLLQKSVRIHEFVF